jgi:Rieske Fe-S protein
MDHPTNHTPPPAEPLTRRQVFFRWMTYGLGAVATVMLGVPVLGFFFQARKREDKWVTLGPTKQFPADQTRLVNFVNPLESPWDGITAFTGVYVRNDGNDEFKVFAVNCAHLGCPVTWFPQSGLFMCPCHGGVYYADGKRASGPPPHGLFECKAKVEKGELKIQAPHYPTEEDTLKEPA